MKLRKATGSLWPAKPMRPLRLSSPFGTIPIVWAAPDRRATLESYVQLYVRQEIQSEALVRNLP